MSQSSSSDPEREDAYFQCIAAHRAGIIDRAGLDACLAFLRGLPPGEESVGALVRAGLLDVAYAGGSSKAPSPRASVASGASGPSAPPRRQEGPGDGASAAPAEMLGPFELRSVVGHGATGTVYRAWDSVLERTVALKVLHPFACEDAERLERFEKEARAAARTEHAGIVRVHGIGTVSGRRFISMELVEGASLSALIPASGMEPRRALEIARDVARGLEAAHRGGVLHRDVKPANILVEPASDGTPGGGRARLVDFGLARLEDSGTRVTRHGEVLGTPAYVAPEQALGRDVDERSDVFALGATLHHAIHGQPPRKPATGPLVFQRVAEAAVPRLGKLLPNLSRDVAAICEKAVEWDPKDRYQTAGELADDIERFLGGEAVRARPAGPMQRVRRWMRRHRAACRIAAVLLAALATGSAALGIRESLARADRWASEAEGALALGDPVSAAEAARGILRSVPWSGARTRAERVLTRALDRLDYPEAVVAFHGGGESGLRAIERDLPEDSVALSQKLWREHKIEELVPHLHHVLATRAGTPAAWSAARLLADVEVALGDTRSAVERLRLLSVTPTASPEERAEAGGAARIAVAVGSPGSATSLGRVDRHDLRGPSEAGDLLLVTGLLRRDAVAIAIWDASDGRPRWRGEHRVAVAGDGGPPASLSVRIGDLDPAGPDPPTTELVVYTAYGRQLDGVLDAYRVQGSELVRIGAPLTGVLGGHDAFTSPEMEVADVTGDGWPDVVVGLASGHESRGERTVVIENPFRARAGLDPKVHTLPPVDPSEMGRNDTSGVFVADLDGDGRPEVGYGTGCWRGYDLRAYRWDRDAESFRLIATTGKIGPVGAVATADLDGDGASEIVAAITSIAATNRDVFPDPPHRGNPEGIYVFRLEDGPGGKRLREIHRQVLGDRPFGFDESLLCQEIWCGRIDGRPAILASWWRDDGVRPCSFVDLHSIESEGSPGVGRARLRPLRIFWSQDRAGTSAHFVRGPHPSSDRIVLLGLEDDDTRIGFAGEWSWIPWSGAQPDFDASAEAVGPLPSIMRAYLALELYEAALGEMDGLHENDISRLDAATWLSWARAAGRAGRWSDLDRIVTRRRALLDAGARADEAPVGTGRAAPGHEWSGWAEAARAGIALREGPGWTETFEGALGDPWEVECGEPLPGGGIRVSIPCPGSGEPQRPFRPLFRPVRLDGRSGVFLRFDVEIEAWRYNQQVVLGLHRRGTRTLHGIHLIQPGGSRETFPGFAVLWGGSTTARTPTSFRPEIGARYRIELEYVPVARRVRLSAARLDAGTEVPGSRVHAAWPPYPRRGSEDDASAEPGPSGEYDLGVFADVLDRSDLTREAPVTIRILAVEARAAGLGE